MLATIFGALTVRPRRPGAPAVGWPSNPKSSLIETASYEAAAAMSVGTIVVAAVSKTASFHRPLKKTPVRIAAAMFGGTRRGRGLQDSQLS